MKFKTKFILSAFNGEYAAAAVVVVDDDDDDDDDDDGDGDVEGVSFKGADSI